MRVEGVEPVFPEHAVTLSPSGDVFERIGADAAQMGAANDAATHELGTLQYAHVLGCRGEGHLEGGGKIRERLLAGGEVAEHGAAGRVRKGLEDAVHRGGCI